MTSNPLSSPPRPLARRPAPSPPAVVASPQNSQQQPPASLKELLSDRGSWMAPPSPSHSHSQILPSSTSGISLESPSRKSSGTGGQQQQPFHFPHHLPQTPSSSDDIDDLPTHHGVPNPLSSPNSSDASFSPSPSIASLRTAKVGMRVLPTRATVGGGGGGHQSKNTTSIDTSSSSNSEEVHNISSLQSPPITSLSYPPSTSTNSKSLLADPFQLSSISNPPPNPNHATKKHTSKGSSTGSDESWKKNLDDAFVEIENRGKGKEEKEREREREKDPRLRPEQDAMVRMGSILGPKMKIISPAPWDDNPISISSSGHPGAVSTTTLSSLDSAGNGKTKENVKPKSSSGGGGRSRSFSVLASRRDREKSSEKEKEREREMEDALVGLGLGREREKDKDKSFLDMGEPSSTFTRSSKSTPNSPSPIKKEKEKGKMSAPPTLPSPPLSITTPATGKLSSSRGRPPVPVMFDLVTPGSLSLPTPPSSAGMNAPHSAPPTMTTFPESDPAIPRSPSGNSPVGGGITSSPLPRLQTSNSILSIGSNGSLSPSITPHATSPLASPFNGTFPAHISGSTSPGGKPGYKLISLEEARQREVDRIAAAAEKRRMMGPVEHIAGGREEAGSRTREREESDTSTINGASVSRSGTSMAMASSGRETPSFDKMTSSAKSLKSKKSGFLKRMMGGDRNSTATPLPPTPSEYDDYPVESYRALPDDYVHSPAVTVSSPANSEGITAQAPPLTTSTSGRVAFLNTPTPDPELRLRKGLAPSLSLRPISMAFSAGLPSDFLAEQESAGSSTPRKATASPLPPTESYPPLQSPSAPSFQSSASTAGTPSIFDSDSASFVSSVATPVTPGFSPHAPFSPAMMSPSNDSESVFAGLQDQFLKAKKTWRSERLELENQIRALQAELEKVKAENDAPRCDQCAVVQQSPKQPESVLTRPRFKGNGGSGALFGSLVA